MLYARTHKSREFHAVYFNYCEFRDTLFENRRQPVEKVSYGFLDIRNDNSSSQIVATTLLAIVITA